MDLKFDFNRTIAYSRSNLVRSIVTFYETGWGPVLITDISLGSLLAMKVMIMWYSFEQFVRKEPGTTSSKYGFLWVRWVISLKYGPKMPIWVFTGFYGLAGRPVRDQNIGLIGQI